jgi:hypothetical protein
MSKCGGLAWTDPPHDKRGGATVTKGIQHAIAAIQDVMLLQSGIRYAPDNPQDMAAMAEPVSICMAGTGIVNYGDGLTIYNPITLRLWLTVAHKDTGRNDAKVIGYGDSVPQALWQSLNLAGTVDSIEQIRIVGYGPWSINGLARYGWAFEIDVRITVC